MPVNQYIRRINGLVTYADTSVTLLGTIPAGCLPLNLYVIPVETFNGDDPDQSINVYYHPGDIGSGFDVLIAEVHTADMTFGLTTNAYKADLLFVGAGAVSILAKYVPDGSPTEGQAQVVVTYVLYDDE